MESKFFRFLLPNYDALALFFGYCGAMFDYRELSLEALNTEDGDTLMDLLLDKAHIALNDGTMFGAQGLGFARLNVGTPRTVLATALEHIREAVVSMPSHTQHAAVADAINK